MTCSINKWAHCAHNATNFTECDYYIEDAQHMCKGCKRLPLHIELGYRGKERKAS